jgi:hypothetical protein
LIYIRLIARYVKLDPKAKVRPILATPRAQREVLEMAIWVLEEKDGPLQGTAFAAEGLDLITAAHVLAPQMTADCPAISVTDVRATEYAGMNMLMSEELK